MNNNQEKDEKEEMGTAEAFKILGLGLNAVSCFLILLFLFAGGILLWILI